MTDFETRSDAGSEHDDPIAAAVTAVDELRSASEHFQGRVEERIATGFREIGDRVTALEARLNRPGSAPETRETAEHDDTGDSRSATVNARPRRMRGGPQLASAAMIGIGKRCGRSTSGAHPWWAMCAEFGQRRLATIVDHIVPHRGDRRLFWD